MCYASLSQANNLPWKKGVYIGRVTRKFNISYETCVDQRSAGDRSRNLAGQRTAIDGHGFGWVRQWSRDSGTRSRLKRLCRWRRQGVDRKTVCARDRMEKQRWQRGSSGQLGQKARGLRQKWYEWVVAMAKVEYQEWGEGVGTSDKAGGKSQRGNLKGGAPRLGTSEGASRSGRRLLRA